MTRERGLILVGVGVGLLFVYARLIEHHYYRLTWSACAEDLSIDELCATWRIQAFVEALIVVGLAVAAWIYFGKRSWCWFAAKAPGRRAR